MAPALLSFLALALAGTATAAVRNSGFLLVKTRNDPVERIGCVTASGRVSTTGCVQFALTDDNKLFQGSNQCSIQDTAQPENTDAIYGRGVYALACAPKYNGENGPARFYTITGAENVLCSGNLACSWDLNTNPGSNVPVWQFRWGSQQLGVPPGHVHVTLEFSPTA